METQEEPLLTVEAGGAQVTLLGTAHVSRSSAAKVQELLQQEGGGFDAVAVELCPSRYNAIVNPDSLSRMDLFAVIREGRVYMVAASLALSAYQQRLAEQFDIEPGAEQRMAIEQARQHGLPVLLIDRELGITLKRAARNLGWWRRLNLFSGLLAGLLSREQVSEEEIERLKQGDVLETTFAEFAQDRADLYRPLIAERDRYMALRLQQSLGEQPLARVLAVVGAGHMKGLAEQLVRPSAAPETEIAALEQVPPTSRLWRLLPWVVVAVILGVFVYGFTRSPALGWNLVLDWVLINGSLSALGTILAAAHPLTVVGAFFAAPLTSLNPTIGAGMVAGGIELSLRRPSVGDFGRLRSDLSGLRGWWRNRVSRVLLVFIFSSLGSALGTYVAGFRIVGRLVGA
ncbi:TraB/GumN family protein [Thiohalocapsa marina]|uniref:TraB/GumN family protein n=1 Tax=Thiohalocapsa marina TaxID=424902 RepID=A0A5M8FPE7_9GAMM|nr:TraB/GumN family protein [Thiohalocapsa marina]KAA6184305.1 TraB/GumN family protein [Thiohalocapsa marina]